MLDQDQLARIIQSSETRSHHAGLSGGKRRVCVDEVHVLASREFMEAFNPTLIAPSAPLVVSNEPETLNAAMGASQKRLRKVVRWWRQNAPLRPLGARGFFLKKHRKVSSVNFLGVSMIFTL
jgi:hypothetical protein